ncbi:MAG: zinc-binding dehydrogenase [Candidatus Korarchaeum sp.]|nr:zinc-binding dehydrogenase [Candidatus Korarchaeum sp.]MDW8035913.1 zinc-binding dehydrogenase [Candidatus Korarchaeum sp.]
MKAVVIRKHGGPGVLEYDEYYSNPKVGPNDVLVEVRATAMNHLDVWVREGVRGATLPRILGSDIAGIVKEVGEAVNDVKVGQEVIVAPGYGCGKCEYCLSGRESMCKQYRMPGYHVDGGYAELTAHPERAILSKPANLSFEEAASVPLVFLTSWHMLRTLAELREGEWVLIWGAGSGVGISSIQIAKLHGAKVITTVGDDWKVERAYSIGADHVINRRKEDVVTKVKEMTGEGVDVVVDSVGSATWMISLKCLKVGGRMVSVGATSGEQANIDVRYVFSKQLRILGSYMGSRAELMQVLKFIESGKLKPVIDSTFRLEEAKKAHERMERSEMFGKILIVP